MAVGSSGKNGRVKSPLPLQKKEINSQENALPSSPSKRNKSPGIRVVGGRIGSSGKNGRVKSPLLLQKKEINSQENALPSSPSKRNKSPGIRVIGGRIYDPVNGKTCHQCRQKTRDFVAACKSLSNKKPCPVMYCHKCLLNRYGEKAEEVDALGVWSCPKCRGICNCSICMKKRGHQPTGILITTAKATGYSSVSEMLLKGVETSNQENVEPVMAAPPKKDDDALPKKQGKKNSVDKVETSLHQVDEKSKEMCKGVEMHDCDKKSKGVKRSRMEKASSYNDEKKLKKTKKDELVKVDDKRTDVTSTRTSPRKLTVCNKPINEEAHMIEEDEANASNDMIVSQQITDFYAETPLPMGTELNSVSKIDVNTVDVGSALQFLEFCAVFRKILGVRNRHGDYVLQDLLQGRAGTGRRGKFYATAQFHILLLSILQKEQQAEREKLSPSNIKWFHALKKYLSESQSVTKAQWLDSLKKASDYETLKASEKLSLLNALCDEVLATEKVRTWMDDQNTKDAEKVKEAKLKAAAAKHMKKSLNKKLMNERAKAIVAKNGEPLSVSENEAIFSRFEREREEARANLLETQGMLSKKTRYCDAVRIEPVFVACGGRNVYWKLKCSGNSNVLRQNVGEGDALTLNEKWFAIDDEGKQVIEKHICFAKEMAKKAKSLAQKN